jgi:hypothetical protein
VTALAAGVLALGLLLGAGAPAAPLVPAAPRIPPADDGPTIELTARNWGHEVSLTDPDHPAYAHLFTRSTLTTVTATIHFPAARPDGFSARLDVPDAYIQMTPAPCSSVSAPATVSCQFGVAISNGVNRLALVLHLPGSSTEIVQHGTITGGVFQFTSALEARDATGAWQRVPDAGALQLSGRQMTQVRTVLRNTGGVPFRVDGGCAPGLVAAGTSVACPLAGPRPVASLAGPYSSELDLTDPLGAVGQAEARGGLVATSASFRLPSPTVTAGRPAALDVSDLPSGPFGATDLGALSLRIGDAPVPARVASSGRLDLDIPAVAPGPASLDVLLAGITIARMPVTVTARPQPPPAAPFPFGLVAIVAAGGALLGLLVWRIATAGRGGRSAAVSRPHVRRP